MARAMACPDVVLTREAGKNGEMARRLKDRSLAVLEMPLVETGEGPDRCVGIDLCLTVCGGCAMCHVCH